MSRPRMQDFVFDERNEEKFADHGATVGQVAFMLYEPDFVVRRNRNRRSGLYLAIGRDTSGICIASPLGPTPGRGVWRPITAWRCKQAEERLLS